MEVDRRTTNETIATLWAPLLIVHKRNKTNYKNRRMFEPKIDECKLITLYNDEPGDSYGPYRSVQVDGRKKNGLGIWLGQKAIQ